MFSQVTLGARHAMPHSLNVSEHVWQLNSATGSELVLGVSGMAETPVTIDAFDALWTCCAIVEAVRVATAKT